MRSYTSSNNPEDHFDDESASQVEFSGVRCGITFSTLPWMIQRVHIRSVTQEIQYPEPEIMADSSDSGSQGLNLSQMRSDLCAFAGCDSSSQVNLIVMANVNDLVVSASQESHLQRKDSFRRFRRLLVSSTSTTSLRIIQWSSSAESSRSEDHVKSRTSCLRSSLTIC